MSRNSSLYASSDTEIDEKIHLLNEKLRALEFVIKKTKQGSSPSSSLVSSSEDENALTSRKKNPRKAAFARQKEAPHSISTLFLPPMDDTDPPSNSVGQQGTTALANTRNEVNLADAPKSSSDSRSTPRTVSFSVGSSINSDDPRASFTPPALTREKGRPELIRRPSVIEEQLHEGDHYKDLSQDTFTLMILATPFSKQWIFGVIVFTLQATLLTMVISEQYSSSKGSTPFDVPYKVPPIVHVGQFLAIILSLATQTDLVISIVTFIMLWFHRRVHWTQLTKVPEDSGVKVWLSRVAFPTGCEFIEGLLVLIATFVIVIQSESIIELFKDFAAMQLISELDNMSFWLALHGYLGRDLAYGAKQARKIKVHEVYITTFLGIPLRSVILLLLFVSMACGWGFFVHGQLSGSFFYQKYPYCPISTQDIIKTSDGVCDGGVLNSIECGFDDGDCISFNFGYPNCFAIEPSKIGDGVCDLEYNTPDCRYDGNDCCAYLNDNYYQDGFCQGGQFNTLACGYDGGDCVEFNFQLSNCKVLDESYVVQLSATNRLPALADGHCDGGDFNSLECDFDGGDCNACNEILRNANLTISKIGDGVCDSGLYMTEPCNSDGGDCAFFVDAYPGCVVDDISLMNNGFCDGGAYFTEECDFDGGDCTNCTVSNPAWVGDGFCDGGQYHSAECSHDGGDCTLCITDQPQLVGNGICDLRFNTTACGYDGGDCLDAWNYRMAKYGFIIESESPSAQPVPMPSKSPTREPSRVTAPTPLPTIRPTASPTISHAPAYTPPPTRYGCFDTEGPFFISIIGHDETCEWVASSYTAERCLIDVISKKCPATCNTCPSPTASPTLECHDLFHNWHDSDGEEYTCEYYGQGNYCEQYGDLFANPKFRHTTANQACCVCGGGFNGSYFPSAAPVGTPTRSPTVSPTRRPTRRPTKAPVTSSGCVDYSGSFYIPVLGRTKNCAWVALSNTEARCDFDPVEDYCLKTCDECDDSNDSDD